MTGSIPYAPLTGVIVTGGGSGIGAATMHALAEAGRPVAAWDLNGDNATRVADEVRQKYGVAAIGIARSMSPRLPRSLPRSRVHAPHWARSVASCTARASLV